jgi:hypothetical protein
MICGACGQPVIDRDVTAEEARLAAIDALSAEYAMPVTEATGDIFSGGDMLNAFLMGAQWADSRDPS